MVKSRQPALNSEDLCIHQALTILTKRLKSSGQLINDATIIHEYLIVKTAQLHHEEFGLLFLDTQLRLIKDKMMFRGSLTHSCVYPREVLKEALACNAAGVVLYHNHPEGTLQPSPSDDILTKQLLQSLKLVDIVMHDHVIVCGAKYYSYSEKKRLAKMDK